MCLWVAASHNPASNCTWKLRFLMMSLDLSLFFLKPLGFSSFAFGAAAGASGAKWKISARLSWAKLSRRQRMSSRRHGFIHTCFLFVSYLLLRHAQWKPLSVVFLYFFQGSLCIFLHWIRDITESTTFFCAWFTNKSWLIGLCLHLCFNCTTTIK